LNLPIKLTAPEVVLAALFTFAPLGLNLLKSVPPPDYTLIFMIFRRG